MSIDSESGQRSEKDVTQLTTQNKWLKAKQCKSVLCGKHGKEIVTRMAPIIHKTNLGYNHPLL